MNINHAILRLGCLVSFCVAPGSAIAARAADVTAPSREQVLNSVERALPYLEKGGVVWIEDKGCVSCHRVSFLTWTFNEADRNGIDISKTKLKQWVEWSAKDSLTSPGEDKPVGGALNLEGLGQLLLAHPATSGVPLADDQRDAFVGLMIKGQQPDGSWTAGGQLPNQKRPKPETLQVSAAWNALALGTIGTADATAARDRAVAWLKPATAGKSTEWYAVRLLLSHQLNEKDQVRRFATVLRNRQNEDGGWGWLLADKSDAFGTGLALYALSVTADAATDPALQRAQKLLLDSQGKDGSWQVRGTKQGKKDRIEETATYWGTAWAVLALLRTAP